MRKSFKNVPRPMLAGVIREASKNTAIAAIKNNYFHGATGIDLHISTLDKQSRTLESLKGIIASSPLPVLALNYNIMYDRSSFVDTEEHRTELLMRAVKAGAAAADIQGYTFDLPSKTAFNEDYANCDYSFIKGKPKEVVLDPKVIEKQMEFIEKVHFEGAEVLLSNHFGIPMTGEQLVELALFLEKRKPDIIKFVAIADTEEEMLEAFRAMIMLRDNVETPVSYHCTGKCGGLTRMVNPVLGGFMCFCNDTFVQSSDFNQPLLETAKTVIENLQKLK